MGPPAAATVDARCARALDARVERTGKCLLAQRLRRCARRQCATRQPPATSGKGRTLSAGAGEPDDADADAPIAAGGVGCDRFAGETARCRRRAAVVTRERCHVCPHRKRAATSVAVPRFALNRLGDKDLSTLMLFWPVGGPDRRLCRKRTRARRRAWSFVQLRARACQPVCPESGMVALAIWNRSPCTSLRRAPVQRHAVACGRLRRRCSGRVVVGGGIAGRLRRALLLAAPWPPRAGTRRSCDTGCRG
jgi:hypothetical protein